MKKVLKPMPFFIICLLLLLVSASGAFVDAKDIIKYGNKFDDLFANIFSLLINIVLIVSLVFALLKYHWAKKLLLVVLYLFLANHILSILIRPDVGDSLVAAIIIGVVLLYIHMSEKLKQAFDQKTHNKPLQPTAESGG